MLWPDPWPLPEDLGLAYENYYTHAVPSDDHDCGLMRRVYLAMKRDYFAIRFGYRGARTNGGSNGLGFLLYFFPTRRRTVGEEVRFLQYKRQGRVLDVGCGSGNWLAFMQDLGWKGIGCDFDPSAVQAAAQRGLDVRLGPIETQNFSDAEFDAVTLNHVIEHLPNPLETLRECLRVLKPGGSLFVATPNANSLSHTVFGKDWRGLELPRHLFVFTPNALSSLLLKAGFDRPEIEPQIAESVLHDSIMLRKSRNACLRDVPANRVARFMAKTLTLAETFLCAFKRGASDCMIAITSKPDGRVDRKEARANSEQECLSRP